MENRTMEGDEQNPTGTGNGGSMEGLDGYTPQMSALSKVEALYGRYKKGARRYGWTTDHLHYRQVGCRIGAQTFSFIADTWSEAIDGLKGKVRG